MPKWVAHLKRESWIVGDHSRRLPRHSALEVQRDGGEQVALRLLHLARLPLLTGFEQPLILRPPQVLLVRMVFGVRNSDRVLPPVSSP